jgi:G3E family GTPase
MKPRLVLVGGFLGAGKTTLLLRTAELLAARGLRVGLVMNDQGTDLVDTALAQAQAAPVVEVAGGCFCCRFPDLVEALRLLRQSIAPDLILAEPVGSCTDLMATVLRPLMAYHPDEYELAPLTILLDPARRVDAYADEVAYLYRQQLAEAELIVLSKADLPADPTRSELQQRLAQQFAPARVLNLSARQGDGIDDWLEVVLNQSSRLERTLQIDYERYAAAEAHLGWLNARGTLTSATPFSPENWINHLLRMLDLTLAGYDAAVAHVKLQATAGTRLWKASLTQSGERLSWDAVAPAGRVAQVEFVLNARVHTTPEWLEQAVHRTFAEVTPAPDFSYTFTEWACFRPAPPTPTHRLVVTP